MKQLLLMIHENGEIEYPINIRKKFPYSSFPDVLMPASLPPGVYFVLSSPLPFDGVIPKDKALQEGMPYKDVSGNWVQNWLVRDLNDSEIRTLAKEKRRERDLRLSATDWTQLKDIPEEISNKYVVYRQELRDMTDDSNFPFNDLPEIK